MAKKICYLTIDDAPSEDFKNKIDFLVEQKVPAIFFCEGKKLEEKPQDIIYAIKKGFVIGNHSYNHSNFSQISITEGREQIRKTDEIIDDLYKQAGVKRQGKVFRFPFINKGGDKKDEFQKVLKEFDYKQPTFKNITYDYYQVEWTDLDIHCTYDVLDWVIQLKRAGQKVNYPYETPEDIFALLDRNEEHGFGLNLMTSNDIILTHDAEETTDIFYPVIRKLLDKGIKFELPKF